MFKLWRSGWVGLLVLLLLTLNSCAPRLPRTPQSKTLNQISSSKGLSKPNLGSGGVSSIGAAINVRSLGAVANGKIFIDGATNSSNNQLTTTTASFSASDVGQTVWCTANPLSAAATLWAAGQTTVASFIDSSTIAYSGTNAGNRSGFYCVIGSPNDSPAIVSAFNSCKPPFTAPGNHVSSQGPACNIYLPSGIYLISQTLNNLISTGNEGCVGIIGDGPTKTVLVPTPTFTQSGSGWVINDRCQGFLLRDFAVSFASVPISASGGVPAGVITIDGSGVLQDVSVVDHINLGNGTLFGIAVTGGTNINLRRPFVQSAGAAGQGGLLIESASVIVLESPFLSNTTQNLEIVNAASGARGAGVTIYGGVIDEGSITRIQNSQDVWINGTTLTGGANCLSVDGTSYVWLTGGYCGTFGGNTGGAVTVASGGKLNMTQVHVNAVNSGSSCYTSAAYGGIVDDGTNRCTTSGGGTVYPSGGFINKTSLTHSESDGFQSGNIAVGAVKSFTVDQSIAVSSITWQPSNMPSCTAGSLPTISITDGTVTLTTSGSDTFGTNNTVAHTFDSKTDVVLNASGSARMVITISVASAGTCGTAPQNVNFSAFWQATAPVL